MFTRRAIGALVAIGLTATATAALAQPAHALDSRAFAIVLCRPTDDTREPRSVDWFANLFTSAGRGTGGLYDYWSDVSYGHVSLDGSEVLTNPDGGWFDTGRTEADENSRTRLERFDDCVSAAESTVDFGRYYGIIAMYNNHGEFGGIGAGRQNAHINGNWGMWSETVLEYPDSISVMVAAHEMGHAMGLGHSFDDSTSICSTGAKPGEYCDPWDIMSGEVVRAYQGNYGDNGNYGNDFVPGDCATWGTYCTSGPGLNAPNIETMGWMDAARRHDGQGIIYLSAINHPEVTQRWGQPTYLEARIPLADDPANHYYTVEYRVPDGWDTGIGSPTVLIHEMRGGRSYLLGTQGGAARAAGAVLHDPAHDLAIVVNGFSTDQPIASVTIERDFTPPAPTPPSPPPYTGGGSGAGGCGATGCNQHEPGWKPRPHPYT